MSRARSERLQWWGPALALAVLVYVPLLLTEPGQVVADTKSYLYLDPGRLLSRSLSMWDPHVGLGTVPHQQIGYLWPSGPWYWFFDAIGAPDWVAQRLWLGTILVAAGGGVLFLGRSWRWRPSAATAAAFLYALSPFVLTLAARISVLLLPFAGLPWLLALTVRALHHRGWRHPALFALTIATIGSVNATSILLVGIVPVLWILYTVFGARTVTQARALTTLTKLGLLTLAVNLWWIAGLSVQATNGLDVLRYTETAQVVADSSSAPEVLRGLGYWFFYGGDRLGPWIEPSVDYTQRLALIALTYALPALGLLALGVVRWRHRAFLVGMVLLGTVIAVGAHPWTDPSPLGAAIKAFLETDVGLAMRSLPRAVPLAALALALGVGSLVDALAEQVERRGLAAAAAVAALAYAALPPLWGRSLAPDNLQRPEELPSYWLDAAAHLDAAGDETRILEVPGIDFASYRWGNTVDPITPGLVDRPYAARELIPQGSDPSADLLRALDLRLQEQTMPDSGLAALARLLGVGDVVARNDLQYERYNTPRPRSLWDLLRSAPGLGDPTVFGSSVPNEPIPEAPLLDEAHLARDGDLPPSPAVAVFPVEDPLPIVRAHSAEQVVLLSGDGAGVVDAATAGLLDGDELIRYSAELTADADFVVDHLVDARGLLVTDSNRKRGQRWTTVRHTEGFTEELDGGILRDDPSDNRLEVVADRPDTQTVAEHRNVSVRATGYGNPISYTPEERPANGVDGDPTTAWRVAAFDDAVGHRIELTTEAPVTTDRIRLLQPQTGAVNRWITEVEIRFDGGDALRVGLTEASRAAPGQVVTFGERSFQEISIEVRADTSGRRPGYGGLTSVGFAEIDVAGLVLDEVIRMPSDLLDAGGYRTLRYPLAIVQTRIRSVVTDVTRTDEEFAIARALTLPTAREYGVRGTARLSGRAPTAVLDALLGRTGAGIPRVTATSTLAGGLVELPSNVLDGDADTTWTAAFGEQRGQTLRIESDEPVALPTFTLELVADDEHSLPVAADVRLDGRVLHAGPLDVGPPVDGVARATVAVPPETAGRVLEIEVTAVDEATTINWNGGNREALPIAVAELRFEVPDAAPLRVPAPPSRLDTGCRDDLVTVAGVAVPVRITGATAGALDGDGLALAGCGPVPIPGGDIDFRTAEGRVTGLDVDQRVWRSSAGGTPCLLDVPLVGPDADDVPVVQVTSDGDTTVEVAVTGATPGRPFWLVFGQSHNTGWSAEVVDGDTAIAGPELVDGYANGYLVDPAAASFTVTLRFTPQNRVDVAILVTLLGVAAAVALALRPARPLRPLPIPRAEPLRRLRALTYEGALPTVRQARVVGVAAGAVATLVAGPLAGVAIGVVAGLATRRETWRWILTLAPAGLLAFAGAYVVVFQYRNEIGPGLHWPEDTGRLHTLGLAAVLLLAVDVAIDQLWVRRSEYTD